MVLEAQTSQPLIPNKRKAAPGQGSILATLHAAPAVRHMDLPGFRLHPLKGVLKGFWAVAVRANWRVIFRFDQDAEDVDYVDYH